MTAVMTITQAADYLGITRQRVHVLVREGKLRAELRREHAGNVWLINRGDVEKRARSAPRRNATS